MLCGKPVYIIHGARIINWKLLVNTEDLRTWFAETYTKYKEEGHEVIYWNIDDQFDYYCSEI